MKTIITKIDPTNNINFNKFVFSVKTTTTALSIVVPKKTSDLTNDSGFVSEDEIEDNLVIAQTITQIDALDDWANS